MQHPPANYNAAHISCPYLAHIAYIPLHIRQRDVRQVEVFFDRNVVEVFLNGGQTAGSMLFQGADGDGELRIASSGKIDAVDARALNGIWR